MRHTHQHTALVAGIIILHKAIDGRKKTSFRLLFIAMLLLAATGTARAQHATDVLTDTGVPGAVCGPAAEPVAQNYVRSSFMRGKIRFETGTSGNNTTMHISIAAGKRNDSDAFFRFSHSHLIESKLLAKGLFCIHTIKVFRQAMRQQATDKRNC